MMFISLITTIPTIRYDKDLATMVRVIREFLKIPETVFTTQVFLGIFLPICLHFLILQEILDICGVLNVNAHELPVTPTPTQVKTTQWSQLESDEMRN